MRFWCTQPDEKARTQGQFGVYRWEGWVELIPEREESGIAWVRLRVSWPGESQPRTVSLRTASKLSEEA